MPQDLVEILVGECGECVGGIAKIAVVDCGYLDFDASVSNASRQITLIVASTPGKVVELQFDDDDTANLGSTGERNNNIHKNNIEYFGKHSCMTNDKILAADTLKRSCCLVAAVQYNNGMEVVVGMDVVTQGVTQKIVKSKTTAKATVSAFSGTGAEEDRIEVRINSVSRNLLVPFADPTVFGYDQFVAL